MSFLSEFKEFIQRGNVIDLATGVVIGAAFGKITSSLVNDIIMPPLGIILGKVDFKELRWVLQAKTASQPEVSINYGLFFQAMVDFVIIAFVIFMIIKAYNKIQRKKEQVATVVEQAPTPVDTLLLTEIRDLLKK